MFYVYILVSEKKEDEIYVGYSKDLKKRFTEHNKGIVQSTKNGCPWKILYYEAYPTEELAREREKQLKYFGKAMGQLKRRIGL